VSSSAERPQYRSVVLNSAVETLDGQSVGVISEVHGQLFKIKTARFHRDFWLRVDSVRTSEPGHTVVLNVDKVKLDEIKIVDPQLQ
jgi:hypothetical protein